MKPTLFVMVGIPGSGKSYQAKKMLEWMKDTTVYISRDAVRLSIIKEDEHYFSHETQVFNTFARECATWLGAGHNVIADATHNSVASRAKLINALAKYRVNENQYDIIFVVMATSQEECIRRDALREGRAHVTAPVIRRFFNNFTFPSKDEFSNVTGVWKIYE